MFNKVQPDQNHDFCPRQTPSFKVNMNLTSSLDKLQALLGVNNKMETLERMCAERSVNTRYQ